MRNIQCLKLLKKLIIFLFIISLFSCSSSQDDIQSFDVNIVVLMELNNEQQAEKTKNLDKEVDILNQYFVDENRNKVVKFLLKSIRHSSELINSSCKKLIELGDEKAEYNGKLWNTTINSCDDPRVVDPHAINFFVYDSYSKKRGFKDRTSHARNNRDRPYLLIDWERLNHNIQSVEEHEMGHAFGLKHVCVEGATMQTSTNIMASAECGKGSGGKRNLGFNKEQLKIILKNAREISAKFRQ